MTDAQRESRDFLAAEEAATQLVEQLTRLRDEIGHYSGASGRLDESAAAIARLAEGLGHSATGLQSVVDTLSRIDTPEVLRRVDQLREDVDGTLRAHRDQCLTATAVAAKRALWAAFLAGAGLAVSLAAVLSALLGSP